MKNANRNPLMIFRMPSERGTMSDLIDRDALKKAIGKVYACDWDDIEKNFHFAEAVNSLPSAEPERIIKIGQRSGKTLESAIDYLHSVGWLQEHDRILTESAEPEPKWIPCNARMPEEREWVGTKRFGTTVSDEVYVTFENPKGERFCKHLSFQNGKLSSFDQSTIDAFYPEAKPIAWMPLPEPWRGE